MLFTPSGQTAIVAANSFAGEQGTAPGEMPKLLRYWRVAVRRRWVIAGVVGACLIAALLATLLMTPRYTATATIEISRQQDRVIAVQEVRPESSAVDMEFYQTQWSLLRARSLAERVARDLKLADNDNFLKLFGEDDSDLFGVGEQNSPAARANRLRKVVEVLLDHAIISPTRGSRIVDVSFTSPDPQLSAQIANAWTSHFIDSNLSRRFEATAYARRFLEDRLDKIRQRLEQSERLLVAYAGRQKIVNLPASSGSGSGSGVDRPVVAEDLKNLNDALAEATAERLKAQGRLSGSSSSTEVLENTAINALRQKRGEAAAEYAKLIAQFQPDYPPARAIAQQIAAYDRSIGREEARVQATVRNQYREAVERENLLRGQVEGLKSSLLDLRRRSIQYNIYQRDVDTNRQLYDGLLQRYKEIGVAGGVGTNNVSIVDAAEAPRKPSSPKLLLNLALGLLLGLLLAAGVTLALEQVDDAIKDPEEASRATGLPLLGAVPRIATSPLVELNDRKSATSEAYLSVQTNLQFATDHGVPRTLAITSTRPTEGKSTTSYAVAVSLARTGRRVILVDGDMRSPSVQGMFGLENKPGVSSFLAGEDNLEELIVPVPEYSMAVMTAGSRPPNAAELLTSTRLPLLLDRLLEHFDHVVIDSPPVVGLADAPLIASRVEGVIYAVEANGPRANLVRTALERLKAAHANILGFVLTKFDPRSASYGYGYDYGYGYGREDARADA